MTNQYKHNDDAFKNIPVITPVQSNTVAENNRDVQRVDLLSRQLRRAIDRIDRLEAELAIIKRSID